MHVPEVARETGLFKSLLTQMLNLCFGGNEFDPREPTKSKHVQDQGMDVPLAFSWMRLTVLVLQ